MHFEKGTDKKGHFIFVFSLILFIIGIVEYGYPLRAVMGTAYTASGRMHAAFVIPHITQSATGFFRLLLYCYC